MTACYLVRLDKQFFSGAAEIFFGQGWLNSPPYKDWPIRLLQNASSDINKLERGGESRAHSFALFLHCSRRLEVGKFDFISFQVRLQDGVAVAHLAWISLVISCVTADEPYCPHPHQLVGSNCSNGIFTAILSRGQTSIE